MWGAITGLLGLGKTWLDGKKTEMEAKAKARAAVMVRAAESDADWERIMAENSGTSWKDEWLTILISIPLILAFIPSAVPYVEEGFRVLDTMPGWYKYVVSVVFAASFGVRNAVGFMKNKVKMGK